MNCPNRTTTVLSDWPQSPTEPMNIMHNQIDEDVNKISNNIMYNQMDQDGNKTSDALFVVHTLFCSKVLFLQTVGTPTLPKKKYY